MENKQLMNSTKSFAENLKAIFDNAVQQEEEQQLKSVVDWVEKIVKPALINAAKELKTSKKFNIPKTLNYYMLINYLSNDENKLTFEPTEEYNSIIIYW